MTRIRLYILAFLLLCSSLYAQIEIKEDKYGNKYYYQKADKPATSVRVVFVSDAHGNTYKVANVIGYKKSMQKANPDDLTLLLWGGDEPKGHPIWGFRRNEIGYTIWAKHADAAVIGNHDLIHYPLDNIDKLINEKKLQFIGTNVLKVDKKKQNVHPYPRYKLIELADGKKILILGLVTQSINSDDRISDKLYMGTPSEEYNEVIRQVESIHGQLSSIFLLAHFERRLDPEKGEDLETFVKKIEKKNNMTIFKGHDHKDGTYFLKANGYLVPVVEVGEALNVIKYVKFNEHDLKYQGHLDVAINDPQAQADSETNILINRMKRTIPIPLQYEALAETLFDSSDYFWSFDRAEIDRRPEDPSDIQMNTPLTAFILDAYKYAINANVAMLESGNVRSGISRKKNVTGMDMYRVIPFENDLVKSQILGSNLEEIIDINYKSGEQRILARGLIQAYDPISGKLIIKKVYNPITNKYEPFNPQTVYTVSSIDHFAKKHSLNMIDEKTGWKDYAAIIGFAKAKNKTSHNQAWIEKYHAENYYCNINREGFSSSIASVEKDIYERTAIAGDNYYKAYAKMSNDDLIKELDLLIPLLRELNGGVYISGLSKSEDPANAAEFVSSASAMYNVWANIYPHQRHLGFIIERHEGDNEAAYHEWMTKLRGFIVISMLFKELHADDPRVSTVWSGYTDRRLKSARLSRTGSQDGVTEASSILVEHKDIKDKGKKIIREMMGKISNNSQKLPAALQEMMSNYNNELIELTKKFYDVEGVRYYTATVYMDYGKYTAIFYDKEGDHYLNKLSKFRSRFGTRLAYLPIMFLATSAGAQYDSDSDKNIFFVSEDAAKGIKDYKNIIHEDIHILFRSLWVLGNESDLNGVIVRKVKKNPLEQDLYINVSLDEVAAYTESISYELRKAKRLFEAGRIEDASLSLENAFQHIRTVKRISSSIKDSLLSLHEDMDDSYKYSEESRTYYNGCYRFDSGVVVRHKTVKAERSSYTELFYEAKGFEYTTMIEELNPTVETVRNKIERQLDLMEKFDALFYDLSREAQSAYYYDLSSDNKNLVKYRLGLLIKELETTRSFYRENIGIDGKYSFADVILAYDNKTIQGPKTAGTVMSSEEPLKFESFEDMINKFNDDKLSWYKTYRPMDMQELTEALGPLLPGLMGDNDYLPGLEPGAPVDAESISKNPSMLYNIQGNIGGGPFAWGGSWAFYLEKYNGDLNKTYESVMNTYKAYSIMNLMLYYYEEHEKDKLSNFLKASLPTALAGYNKKIISNEHEIASKVYDRYLKTKAPAMPLNRKEVISRLSGHTGSSSSDLVEQLDKLMMLWLEKDGALDLSDRELLFGMDETETGIYEYVYQSVINDTERGMDDLKFFLILSGALSYKDASRSASRMISAAYVTFGLLSIDASIYVKEKMQLKGWDMNKIVFMKSFSEGIDAVKVTTRSITK